MKDSKSVVEESVVVNPAKFEVALVNIKKVCETLLGIDAVDITVDSILGSAPAEMSETDPKRDLYLGADQIDMMKMMLYIEQEFNKEVDDALFVPRKDVVIEDMWRERPVRDLVTFCANTLL